MRTALQRHHVQARFRQLFRHNGTGPAEADNHRVHFSLRLPCLCSFSTNRYRWEGIALAALHPVHKISARAGEADQLPAHHVLIAAMQRIAEKALAGVLQQVSEEDFRWQLLKARLVAFKLAEQRILLFGAQRGKSFAMLLSRQASASAMPRR